MTRRDAIRLLPGLALLAGFAGGCGGGDAAGDLPEAKAATPEELAGAAADVEKGRPVFPKTAPGAPSGSQKKQP
jgi:hypothetical protein